MLFLFRKLSTVCSWHQNERRSTLIWTKEKYMHLVKIRCLVFFKKWANTLSEQQRQKTTITKPKTEERAKFALHIFKHCWFASQPWMAIVAYALYMLYSKSISAMAGQPEGKARNFPFKKKRSCCSQEFCSQVNSIVSSFLCKTDLASSSSITPPILCSKVLNYPLMFSHCYSICSVSYWVFHFH